MWPCRALIRTLVASRMQPSVAARSCAPVTGSKRWLNLHEHHSHELMDNVRLFFHTIPIGFLPIHGYSCAHSAYHVLLLFFFSENFACSMTNLRMRSFQKSEADPELLYGVHTAVWHCCTSKWGSGDCWRGSWNRRGVRWRVCREGPGLGGRTWKRKIHTRNAINLTLSSASVLIAWLFLSFKALLMWYLICAYVPILWCLINFRYFKHLLLICGVLSVFLRVDQRPKFKVSSCVQQLYSILFAPEDPCLMSVW